MLLMGAALLFAFRGKIATYLAPMLGGDINRINFYAYGVVLAASISYLVPMVLGMGSVKRMLYTVALWSQVLNSGFTVYTAASSKGRLPPKLQGFSMAGLKATMQAAQPFFQEVMSAKEFHFLFFALIFLTAYPDPLVLFILGRRALFVLCNLAPKCAPNSFVWLRFQPTWEKLKQKEKTIVHYSVLAEIFLGFWLVVQMAMPTRQMMTTFLYWNYLKIRYQSPQSNATHGAAWRLLQEKTAPVFKAVPFLNTPLNYVQNWFKPQY